MFQSCGIVLSSFDPGMSQSGPYHGLGCGASPYLKGVTWYDLVQTGLLLRACGGAVRSFITASLLQFYLVLVA